MNKKIRGGCTFCGLCGCLDKPEADGQEWCEGLPETLFNWYKQHPEDEEILFKLLREEMGKHSSTIVIPDIDTFSFFNHEGVGVGTSETDKSCPFLDQSTIHCKLWGTEYLPRVCATTPQLFTSERRMREWKLHHPKCDFYWIDE